MTRRSFSNFGGRAKSEDEQKRILDRVHDLKCQGYSRAQISKLINRSEPMVTKYFHHLVSQDRLKRTQSGRIEKPRSTQAQQANDILKSEWLDGKNPEVHKWIEKMQSKGLQKWKTHVNSFYVVCKTLNVQPVAFLVSDDETERLLTRFRELFHENKAAYVKPSNTCLKYGKETSVRLYVSAVANFCWRNGKPFTSSDGIMSRKKENYGAYSNVQLSDSEVEKILDFLRDHSTPEQNWEALAAIGHEMIPRPDTLLTMRNNIVVKQEAVEDHACTYGEAIGVYEKKTKANYDKLIFNPRCLDLARALQPNRPFIQYTDLSHTKKTFNKLLREAYASIDRIAAEAVDKPSIYKKVKDGDRFYLANKPGHALRHSGCHLWMRRCHYNPLFVASLGWEDVNMITQVYGKMPNEERLQASQCYHCRPPKVKVPGSNVRFCSWAHSLIYYNKVNAVGAAAA